MCGICGIYNLTMTGRQGGQYSLMTIKEMTRSLSHRGPDYGGYFLESWEGQKKNGNIETLSVENAINYKTLMGHRRLSIVDLSDQANQPMTNEDQTLWMVANGEIYNHFELRTERLRQQHDFKSKSDVEVILHLYEETGEDAFKLLNGIFAIALWDSRKGKLILVRDRFGVKPLYYYQDEDKIVFASEMKAFLHIPEINLSVNVEKLAELITFRYIAGEDTCFKQIKEVLPGYYLIRKQDAFMNVQFWSNDNRGKLLKIKCLDDVEAALDEMINVAVKRQLMSDVPVGTLNSGGLDSSLLTALAKRFYGEQLTAFSVGFHEKECDETPYATMLADHVIINIEKLYVDDKEYADNLLKTIWYLDEPVTHHNSVQLYLILKYARKRLSSVEKAQMNYLEVIGGILGLRNIVQGGKK